ncbi:hypothetical protein Q8A67_011545 [Cirrhinus molitorella]|uniref:DUF4806 domain-containing protein n=1 Tax=Cirrhinus molitorella TaxID=172907 RepID=A0AA88Q2L6_9TELE|nr:hypothetical protein Q8A67_011545 [Cirrhinus molitorella]
MQAQHFEAETCRHPDLAMRGMAIAPGKEAGQGTASVVAGFYWLASSPYFWSTSRVFQKKVLSLLVDIRHRLKETQPASSAVRIERMDTMEDFELQEQSLSDAQAFDTLVLQISRIGGRNTKDCAHKVLDRLFTNSLMAKFNLKGKGKRGKRPLEGTKVYRAIQEGIMKFDNAATEEFIKGNAPQRIGGGGFAMP